VVTYSISDFAGTAGSSFMKRHCGTQGTVIVKYLTKCEFINDLNGAGHVVIKKVKNSDSNSNDYE
jgi:hypothetical protein